MKRFSIYSISLLLFVLAGCTDKFDEINTDPTQSSESTWDPNFFLPNAQMSYINLGYGSIIYQSLMTQVLASTFYYYGNGDKYVNTQNSTSYQGNIFGTTYNVGRLLAEMQRLTEGKEQYSNLYNVGRILQVMNFQQGTDTYGDLPYTEAFKVKDGISTPKYDTQQAIYAALLPELESAINGLDAAKLLPTGDLYYAGDVAKWKKFGYSLMLRLAMRLTKVDAATAKTWAEKAAAGGTFASIDDSALIVADAANANSSIYGVYQVADDFRELRFSKTFIDALKTSGDPRLSAVAEVPAAGAAANANQAQNGNNATAIQMGLPNGYDLIGGATDITKAPGYPGPTGTGNDVAPLGNYSRPKISAYLKRDGTLFVLTYPETELLLAEAKARGWNVPGTAAEHYKNGVVGGMASMAQLDKNSTIDPAAIQAFAGAHPLDVSSLEASLKMINTEYWLVTGTMFNFMENWHNWRRSGYPVLTPVNYPGNVTGATIPRRMIYLSTEIITNGTSYKEAVGRLNGGDMLTGRVWWDK